MRAADRLRGELLDRRGIDTGRFNKILLDVTTVGKCNLRCPVCYRSGHDEHDMPIEEIRRLSETHSNKVFLISGGEPTTRPDLGEIIRMLSRRNICFLMTNGVKLADRRYAEHLASHGLKYVSFSLNGFDDDVMLKTHGARLIKVKMKALDNLAHIKAQILLSVCLSSGVNEHEIPSLFDYYMRNMGLVRELRIRSMAPIGSRIGESKYQPEGMLSVICQKMGLDMKDMLKESEFEVLVNRHIRPHFTTMPCKLNFHLRIRGGKPVPIFQDIDIKRIRKSRMMKAAIMSAGLSAFGPRMLYDAFIKTRLKRETMPWIHGDGMLKVSLRSWRDRSDFDSDENLTCPTGYYIDGKLVSFCRANLIKDMGLEKELKKIC